MKFFCIILYFLKALGDQNKNRTGARYKTFLNDNVTMGATSAAFHWQEILLCYNKIQIYPFLWHLWRFAISFCQNNSLACQNSMWDNRVGGQTLRESAPQTVSRQRGGSNIYYSQAMNFQLCRQCYKGKFISRSKNSDIEVKETKSFYYFQY